MYYSSHTLLSLTLALFTLGPVTALPAESDGQLTSPSRSKQVESKTIASGQGKVIKRKGKRPVFVVVPHADDWQLFAGDYIVSYLRLGEDITVVQLTSGVGTMECWEKGNLASLITSIDQTVKTFSCPATNTYNPASCDHVTVHGHRVRKCVYKNASIYFLRLPATWCPTCGHDQFLGLAGDGRTLINLYLGKIPNLSAVDGSAKYTSFSDLTDTVSEISRLGSRSEQGIVLTFDPQGFEMGDHLDHAVAGCTVVDGSYDDNNNVLLFSGYNNISKSPSPNLSPVEFKSKNDVFTKAFGGTVPACDWLGDVNSKQYQDWLARTVVRGWGGILDWVSPIVGRPYKLRVDCKTYLKNLH